MASSHPELGERIMRSAERVRVVVVGGIPVGVVVVGIGSRLAMLLLRLTSPDHVRGAISDDGFTIGRVTLAGTYNLLLLGASVGVLGACVYQLVRRWLIGPVWFRRTTTGLAAAAVAGSMLVHSDGVDFTLLRPTWLAIGLFVALPGAFGALIGSAVDRVARPDSWTAVGRRRWILPVVAVACFPLSLLVVLAAAAIAWIGAVADNSDRVARLRSAAAYAMVVRSAWTAIATAGLIALAVDIAELT